MLAASTDDYVARFCSHLDLEHSIRSKAIEVVQLATEKGILAGKSPLSIAAAAIYMICQLYNVDKSERDISPVAGVSEATIKNAYKDLWLQRFEVVPKTFTPVIPLALLPSPMPSLPSITPSAISTLSSNSK
jgi:transcription initiation factor TFIIB